MKYKASVDESVATQKLAGMWRSTDHFAHRVIMKFILFGPKKTPADSQVQKV